jgi:hypothetical protein
VIDGLLIPLVVEQSVAHLECPLQILGVRHRPTVPGMTFPLDQTHLCVDWTGRPGTT